MKTFAELVEALRRLHIVDDGQLDALTRRYAGQNPDPRLVAKQLVKHGLLTHYQANQLFKGRGQDLLLGSYVLIELVGEGGMGAVYKARNWKLGQIVAVKLIRPERLANEAARRRFEREIRASAHLQHPNIVRAIDADHVGDTHLLVMEFVPDGRDLNRIVREHGPLPITDACRYARHLGQGLQHAHERGLVHRDIKPHNVLVSGSAVGAAVPNGAGAAVAAAPLAGTAKILDFGLARLGESEDSTTLTKEGSVMGTVDYLAPEQARNAHEADIRADLYSVGCTLYYLLAGHAPFVGGTATEKIYKHQFEEPTPIELIRPEVPAGLANIVRKLMAKRPPDRYQTPAEFVRDLDALAAGKPIGASTSSVRLPPAAPAPVAAATQAMQDTENPFASLSTSDTSADGPVSVRLRQPAPAAAPKNKLIALAIAGGAGALFFLAAVIVTAVLVLHRRPTQVVEGPEPVLPPHTTRDRSKDRNPSKKPPEPIKETEPPKDNGKPKEPDPGERKRLEAEKRWLAQEVAVRANRTAEADEAYKAIEAAFNQKDVTFATFARELAGFNSKHGGTPAALRAAALLGQLRSPLDALDAGKLSDDAKTMLQAWQDAAAARIATAPAAGELVAVHGDQRGRHWGTITEVQFVGADGKYVLSAGAGTVMIMAADTRAIVAVFPQMDVWAVAPDGKRVATGSLGGKLQLYDLDVGRTLWHTEAFIGGGVRALCFSPDGKTVAAGGGDGRVGFWDARTGTKARDYSANLGGEIWTLVYPRDGSVLAATINNGNVCLINPRKPQEAPPILTGLGGPAAMLFSPDGKMIAVQWTAKLRIVDVATRKELLSVDDLNADSVSRGLFSPDGRYYAFREGIAIRVWPLLPKVGPVRKWESHPDGGNATFAFSADSKELWTGSGPNAGEIQVWDPATGKALRKGMPGYDEPVRSITDIRMAPDGNIVAWLCGGKNVRLWRRDKHNEQAMIRRLEGGPFAFSADGKRVVTGDFNMVRVWDAQTGLEKPPLRGRSPIPANLVFSPDARLLLAADVRGIVQRWSLGGAAETDLAQWPATPCNSQAPRLAFLADGQRFLTFGEGGQVWRWHLAAEAGTAITGNQYGCCVSPNGRFLLVNPVEGHIAVWDVSGGVAKEGTPLDKLQTETPDLQRIVDVAVTPDERFAVLLHGANRPRMIVLRALQSGAEVLRLKDRDCARVAVAPDGQHLVTTDYDGSASLFDLHTGTFVRKLDIGPDLAPLPALFSPDGKLAAFVSRSTVVVIDFPSGNRVKEWTLPGAVSGIAFAPDGRHLAAGNSNGTIYVLRLPGGNAPPKTAAAP